MGLLKGVGNHAETKKVTENSEQHKSGSAGGINEQEKSIFSSLKVNTQGLTASDYLNNPKLYNPKFNILNKTEINSTSNKLDFPDSKLTAHSALDEADETYKDENGNICNVYYNEDGSYQIERDNSNPYLLKISNDTTIEKYDKDGNLIAKQEGNKLTTYNKDGSVAKTTEYKLGKDVVTLYNKDGSINTKTEYNKLTGNIESTEYNEDGSYTTTTYDQGRLNIGINADKATKTECKYDKDGNLISKETFYDVDMAEERQKKIDEAKREAFKELLEEYQKKGLNFDEISKKLESDGLKNLKDFIEDKTKDIDTDGDGIITEEELEAYNERKEKDISDKLDRNGDGKITQDEIDRYNKEKKDKTKEIDTDGDGIITAEEVQAYYEATKAKEAEEVEGTKVDQE